MMWFEVGIFTAFALFLGTVVVWMWRQRAAAEAQAKTQEQLALLGREVRGIGHDFRNLLAIVMSNLEAARTAKPAALAEILHDLGLATHSAKRMTDVLVGTKGADGPGSTEGVVRLAVAIARRSGGIALEVGGDFPFRGDGLDALRLVLNLLVNATRETAAFPDEAVQVTLDARSLRVTNRLREGTRLDDAVYSEGKSGRSSSGLGLGIARETAKRLGWSVRHEVADGWVTFVVEPLPQLSVVSA